MDGVTTDDGVALAVQVDGPSDGPAVLMLHSLGCDHRMWDAQAHRLAEQWRVIRPDGRGHGRSEASRGDLSLARLAADAVAIVDALSVDEAVVCGLSLGGAVAQQVAISAPARVRGLVLANTAARIGSPEAWAERARIVRADGLAAIADLVIGRFFSEAFRAENPALVEDVRRTLLATSAEGYAGCCAALGAADLRDQVGRIAAPTLVIGGRLDVSTPPEQTRALAALIEGASYVELEAAHLSNLEQPDAFDAALQRHLEQF